MPGFRQYVASLLAGRILSALLLSSLIGVALSGCASLNSAAAPAVGDNTPATGVSPRAASPVPAASTPEAEPVASGTFSPDILYQLLVAEIAAQRGELGIAIGNYLASARRAGDAGIARRATQLAVFAQSSEAALEAGRLWISLEPGNPEPYQLVAPILLAQGDEAGAVALYSDLIALQGEDTDRTYKLIGGQLARERNPEVALAAMAQIVAAHPRDPHARLAQAHVSARHAELDAALAAVDEAMVLSPNWSEAVVMRANILSLQGRQAEAIEALAETYEAGGQTDSGIGLNLAKMLAESGDMARARDIFETLSRQQPDNADVHYAAGILALQFRDLEQAEFHLQRVLELGQRRQEATYHLGLVYEQTDRRAQAIELYSTVLISEYYIEAQMRAASLMADGGDLAGARAYLQRVRANSDEDRVRLYLLEGELLGEAGQQQDAIAFFTSKLSEYPDNSSLRYSRALMAEKVDNLAQAEADLLHIINREPDNAQALNALGYTLADRTDRLQEALTYISRALEMQPDDAVIMDSMGWVQYRLGNHREALRILRQAYAQFDDPEIAAHLGEVLWVLDKKQEAVEVWNASLDKHPNHTALLQVMQRFGL